MSCWLFCVCLSCLSLYSSAKSNDRPIIGLLAQEVHSPKPRQTAYIAASYVKFLESAGARVVPVVINQTVEEYKALFSSINGFQKSKRLTYKMHGAIKALQLGGGHNAQFLLELTGMDIFKAIVMKILYPGGGVSIISSGYERAAKIFYELAIEANKRGDYFPVWGTCLGFEQLTYLTSAKTILSNTDTSGVPLPLNFTNETNGSRMFKGFPAELMEALASEPLTENSHKWSLAVVTYNTNEELKKFYKVLSTNTDGKIEFVSTVEAYDYPIYGTQWHPEKNAFEWTKPYIPHSPSAVKTTFYMAEFFVNEARKNMHRFETEEGESKALIYNYSPVYTGPKGGYEQIYYF